LTGTTITSTWLQGTTATVTTLVSTNSAGVTGTFTFPANATTGSLTFLNGVLVIGTSGA
jgi:hypothetical protein